MARAIDEAAVIGFTQELVRRPSVLGNEAECAQRVVSEMRRLGYVSAEIDEAGNAVGVIEAKRPGPTVILDGHLDTVDIVPREAWKHDPFGAEIVDGRMYGRGTTDMKGAVAAMVHGSAAADRDAIAGRIIVSASVGEETIEGGALEVVMKNHPADYVIIGECTGLNIARAGRGRAEFTVTTKGKAAHASTPHLGQNAIHAMMAVIREVEALPRMSHPTVGAGLTTLTDIHSEPYPARSVIPSLCMATFERRLVPGEIAGPVVQAIYDAFHRAGANGAELALTREDYLTYTGKNIGKPKWFDAWVADEDSAIVERALEGLLGIGQSPELSAYQFCTNAAYSAGVAHVPTIGYGPSYEAFAHVADEYIELAQLIGAAEGYAAIVEALCCGTRS